MGGEIPTDWPMLPLEDVMEAIIDYRGKTPKKSTSGIPLITAKIVKAGRIEAPTEFIAEDLFDDWMIRGLPKRGDVVLTTEAPLGEVAQLSSDNVALAQRIVTLRGKSGLLDNDFLLYLMQSDMVQHQLQARSSGSTVKGIKQSELRKILLPVPPFLQQVFIGKVLKSLDDKIEVNRAINRTLEAMAQAIFKSWFVDFDPVKAKMAARESGTDPTRAAMAVISGKNDTELDAFQQQDPKSYERLRDTAQAFPDALVESELGMIPEGWGVKPLDKVANYLNGLALQKFPPENESEWLPVIKIAQLKKGDSEGADRASANIKPEYIVDDGDVIFSWSGSLEVEIWCGGKGALNQHLFKVTSEEYPKWFYLHWTKHHLAQFKQIAADKAVTMGHIKRGHLSEALCVVPNDALLKMVDMTFEHLVSKQVDLQIELKTLSQLRDTLLPELLSGSLATLEYDREETQGI